MNNTNRKNVFWDIKFYWMLFSEILYLMSQKYLIDHFIMMICCVTQALTGYCLQKWYHSRSTAWFPRMSQRMQRIPPNQGSREPLITIQRSATSQHLTTVKLPVSTSLHSTMAMVTELTQFHSVLERRVCWGFDSHYVSNVLLPSYSVALALM